MTHNIFFHFTAAVDFPPIPKEATAGGRCQSCAAGSLCATVFPPTPTFWQEIYGRVDVC